MCHHCSARALYTAALAYFTPRSKEGRPTHARPAENRNSHLAQSRGRRERKKQQQKIRIGLGVDPRQQRSGFCLPPSAPVSNYASAVARTQAHLPDLAPEAAIIDFLPTCKKLTQRRRRRRPHPLSPSSSICGRRRRRRCCARQQLVICRHCSPRRRRVGGSEENPWKRGGTRGASRRRRSSGSSTSGTPCPPRTSG